MTISAPTGQFTASLRVMEELPAAAVVLNLVHVGVMRLPAEKEKNNLIHSVSIMKNKHSAVDLAKSLRIYVKYTPYFPFRLIRVNSLLLNLSICHISNTLASIDITAV